jgi:hypothetical protein
VSWFSEGDPCGWWCTRQAVREWVHSSHPVCCRVKSGSGPPCRAGPVGANSTSRATRELSRRAWRVGRAGDHRQSAPRSGGGEQGIGGHVRAVPGEAGGCGLAPGARWLERHGGKGSGRSWDHCLQRGSYGECRSLGGATGALGSGDRPGGAKRSLEVKSPASLPRARGRPEESLSGQVSVPVEPERCSGRHCAR